jgi:hypothetical protein
VAIQQNLADSNADVTDLRSSHAYSHYCVGNLLSQTSKPVAADSAGLGGVGRRGGAGRVMDAVIAASAAGARMQGIRMLRISPVSSGLDGSRAGNREGLRPRRGSQEVVLH